MVVPTLLRLTLSSDLHDSGFFLLLLIHSRPLEVFSVLNLLLTLHLLLHLHELFELQPFTNFLVLFPFIVLPSLLLIPQSLLIEKLLLLFLTILVIIFSFLLTDAFTFFLLSLGFLWILLFKLFFLTWGVSKILFDYLNSISQSLSFLLGFPLLLALSVSFSRKPFFDALPVLALTVFF